ncbi:transposase, partial [Corynebacterium striatum]
MFGVPGHGGRLPFFPTQPGWISGVYQTGVRSTVCGADYGTTSDNRVNQRNGYRHRLLDTRVGTVDVAIPKLRQGSFFPDWLLERRTRTERALTTVIARCYLKGVSTRRMNDLVATLGITNLSKSQVSEMAKDLDSMVEDF